MKKFLTLALLLTALPVWALTIKNDSDITVFPFGKTQDGVRRLTELHPGKSQDIKCPTKIYQLWFYKSKNTNNPYDVLCSDNDAIDDCFSGKNADYSIIFFKTNDRKYPYQVKRG